MSEARRNSFRRVHSFDLGSIRGGRFAAHCQSLLLMLFLALCFQAAASAQCSGTYTFTGTGGDGLWSDLSNWSPTPPAGGPNGNCSVIILAGLGGPTGGAILTNSVSIVNLTINTNAQLAITNGSTLTITGTSISNAGALAIQDVDGFSGGGTINIANTVTLSGAGTTTLNGGLGSVNIISGTGTLINQQTINGTAGGTISVSLQNAGTITGGPTTHPLIIGGPTTNSGKILGSGFTAIIIQLNTVQNAGGTIDGGGNSGEVQLSGCTINGGTIGSASASLNIGGLDTPTLNGVTIAPTGVYSVTSTTAWSSSTVLEGTITNNGQIVVTAPSGGQAATLNVSGSVTLGGTGQTNMSGTNASIEGTGTNPSLTIPFGQVVNGGSITGISTLNNQGEIFNAAAITDIELVDNTGGTVNEPTYIDVVNWQNGMIQSGPSPGTTLSGGVILTGTTITGGSAGVVDVTNATFDGSTTPNTIETTVVVGDNDSLTLKGTLDVDTGGELFLDCFADTATVYNSGAVTVAGTGEIASSNCTHNNWDGTTGTSPSLTISLPTVAADGLNLGDGTFSITVDKTTTVTNGGDELIMNTGTKKFHNLGTLVELDGTIDITGGFTNYNSTTNTLTGGYFIVSNGYVQWVNADLINNASNLTLNGNGGIENQNGVGALTTFSNNESSGTFTLANEQTFTTGGTFNNEGKVTIDANCFFTIGGTDTSYIQSGSKAVTTDDGRISTPTGGEISITAGTLQGAGQFYGDVSVGNTSGGAAVTFIVGDSTKSSAQLTLENGYTQLATGTLDIQIGGTTVGSEYSQLNVTGPVTLGGTLTVTLINKFKGVSGDQFTIINAPSGVTGVFTTLKLPKDFSVVYNPTSVVLEEQ